MEPEWRSDHERERKLGPAGTFAHAWIDSKLTPLVIAGSMLLGAFAVWKLPREEEPQIIVPMVDVFVQMPGASAREVEERVTKPMEKLLWEIPGVEYIYSTSSPGMSTAIVRFLVGQDEEKSIVRLNQKLAANLDLIPPGASQPLVKPRSIDDVPILALTFWSKRYGDFELRRIAAQVDDTIKQTPDVSAVALIGGQRREIRITLEPGAPCGLQPLARSGGGSAGAFQSPSALGPIRERQPAVSAGDRAVPAHAGRCPQCRGRSRKRQADLCARRRRGERRRRGAVAICALLGWQRLLSRRDHRGFQAQGHQRRHGGRRRPRSVWSRLRGSVIPSDVEMTITRNYGDTAKEKSNELLYHMLIAVISVSVLIAITLGLRESLIVFTAIPVTLALTLTVFYLYGYTLNRITLFALIFSIGILVDDAIVVVENIVRHWRMPDNQARPPFEVAVEAVDEVGNPTILATLAVVAAILPMAFVGGLMGPYMRPIPIGASAAMLFSLLVAFIVTPWAAVRILKPAACTTPASARTS